ncbi:type I-E CRISPR-associated protein Cas5/CasD [Bifidobacterium sp. B4001]|uniref:type I-E CRISPR-associated protein Cas5/CasD n=1 Tax=unclassified Bifidobacterium TaxID=2608897 RepID=UPI00226B2420|nr:MULTISPECIES: type I-E CRISPR-associated protein Cas5/CasD [unclassified Bifidobacterium]MCX8673054.1 type I-E CRISPR-associated protein Cas5/CasD [Bifidobacterium sp. B4079]MCX8681487.1 type I-E CRISPR-associated protein Cas5/CasD [Bifidobacterium sp. B4001]
MSVLLLRLSGPLQSWGSSSRFEVRHTGTEPTKSAVIGLLASAQGRLRGDEIEDLLHLHFGVRIDQPGRLVNDMQTAEQKHQITNNHVVKIEVSEEEGSFKCKKKTRRHKSDRLVTHRYYLSDAKFLVALGADSALLEGLDQALRHPRWSLYLGRRACPPDYPVSLGLVQEEHVDQALRTYPWIAADWYKKRHKGRQLEVVCDKGCAPDVGNGLISSQTDIPVSFGSARKYAVRTVNRYKISNPDGPDPDEKAAEVVLDHDPMSFF